MNLLLTCSVMPDLSRDDLEIWKEFCLFDWVPGWEIVPYLRLAPASAHALIDAIVFLPPNLAVGYKVSPEGDYSLIDSPWEGHYGNAFISNEIRNLPDSCAMRDGRKWKKIPQIVLTDSGFRHPAYAGLDLEFVWDVTKHMRYSGYATPVTWNQIEKIINRYHVRVMKDYERVGFLVIVEHGVYRVKRAYQKKSPAVESEFYYGSKDKRRFRGFVTVAREPEGVDYEAELFEQRINDPRVGEREIHHFFEEHPDFLAEVMEGVPISHQPNFTTNKQTPDFAISPILPRDRGEGVGLLELKGPDAKVLGNKKYLHRGLTPAVVQALNQIRDYDEAIHDPLNLGALEKALGYLPKFSRKAVLIGRTPPPEDSSLWEKRRAEQASVAIITYDEILEEQRSRRVRRR
jgi:hypothetical protein